MEQQVSWQFPRPSKPILGFMVGLFAIWIAFALGLNYLDVQHSSFDFFAGDSALLFRGHVWRLLTAPLIHRPTGPGNYMHILITLMLMWFFLPALEQRWGTKRLFLFLFGSALFAYLLEAIAWQISPSLGSGTWYGAMVMADAAIVAWAVGNRDGIIRLFFVIPMKPMVMVGLMAAFNVIQLIAADIPPEGRIAPFAAMAAGYLFGDRSHLRQIYLKWKLRRIQSQVDDLTKQRKKRIADGPNLRVIKGGADDDDEPRVLH